jgi:hypothetical protein
LQQTYLYWITRGGDEPLGKRAEALSLMTERGPAL